MCRDMFSFNFKDKNPKTKQVHKDQTSHTSEGMMPARMPFWLTFCEFLLHQNAMSWRGREGKKKKRKKQPIGLFEFHPFISPKRVSLVKKKKNKTHIISNKKVVIIGLTLSPPPLLRMKACKNILIIHRKKKIIAPFFFTPRE